MHETNLRRIDLNLLVILDALLAERSVTRAAARLYLSQPAVSHALDRLRSLFDDPLLERRGSAMVPTRHAEALRPRLAALMDDIHGLVDLPVTPLADLKQTVRLSLADYPSAILLPPLWRHLQAIAPGIQLACQDWHEGPHELERLRRGDTDIVLSMFGEVPVDIGVEHLGMEDYVGIARPGHPLSEAPDMAEVCRYPHILVSAVGALRSGYDRQLAEAGWQRTVGLSVGSFLAVPSIIQASDALALVAGSLARHWAGMGDVRRFMPPIVPPPFPIHLGYHKRRAKDAGIMAVVEGIRSVASVVLNTAAPPLTRMR